MSAAEARGQKQQEDASPQQPLMWQMKNKLESAFNGAYSSQVAVLHFVRVLLHSTSRSHTWRHLEVDAEEGGDV